MTDSKQVRPGMVVYLSGRMRNELNYNFHTFNAFANALRKGGVKVINPAETMGGDTGARKETYMAIDFSAIREADAVVVINDHGVWVGSEGAKAEVVVASALGKPVFIAFSDEGGSLVLESLVNLRVDIRFTRDMPFYLNEDN